MMSCSKSEIREILEWELSLDESDLRSHAWYHGPLSRIQAESLLVNNGDFLVRDCTSSGKSGDFVLSTKWENKNLHFLVHRDILQADTIYEKLSYRFENDHFDTVSDLITYHVGSGIPISSLSGALIYNPKNRSESIENRKNAANLDSSGGDYVSLNKAASPIPVRASFEKSATHKKHQSLNLNPPQGLIEQLEEIPVKILSLINKYNFSEDKIDETDIKAESSTFDLNSFESIFIPSSEEFRLNSSVLDVFISKLLETNERVLSLHLTQLDLDYLKGDNCEIYENLLHNSTHRWNNIIERSLTFTHFVIVTILKAKNPEPIVHKWILVANELKTSLGNFFSFSSIMRALLHPDILRCDGKVDWMKLRRDFTKETFNFETGLRLAYQELIRGTEIYPPNTTLPELFTCALILEEQLNLLPISCIQTQEDENLFLVFHLEGVRSLRKWTQSQTRNLERHFTQARHWDFILSDIFKTELHLLFLWGIEEYEKRTLKNRCENFAQLTN